MMSDTDILKICEKIAEKLRQKEIPPKPTGKLIINLQTGGISGQAKLEITL
jgi:hypothetical protein